MHPADRGRLLYKLADLVEAHAQELATLDTLDMGKPLNHGLRVDLPMVIDCLRYYAGWADKLHGETVPVRGNYFAYVLRQPVGVVGQIIPWNFPSSLRRGSSHPRSPRAARSSSSLPSSRPCPRCAWASSAWRQAFRQALSTSSLARRKRAPPSSITRTSTRSPSPAVRRWAALSCAPLPDCRKRLSLELGGKSPNIIFADADMDSAVRAASSGVFFNQGEVCSAGSCILVEKPRYEEFVDRLVQRSGTIRVGDPLEGETYMGPIVSQEQFDRFMGYIEIGRGEGATLRAGGERLGDRGYFVKPTVFAEVDNRMRIAREEIFGPVAAVIPFSDAEEAVQIADAGPYGLAAAIWTSDIGRAHRIAHQLRAGTVWINSYGASDTRSPWGGFKDSGFGRELGLQALDLYSGYKAVLGLPLECCVRDSTV